MPSPPALMSITLRPLTTICVESPPWKLMESAQFIRPIEKSQFLMMLLGTLQAGQALRSTVPLHAPSLHLSWPGVHELRSSQSAVLLVCTHWPLVHLSSVHSSRSSQPASVVHCGVAG